MEKSIAKTLLKIALPILIGLSVTAWLFCDEFSADSFRDFSWSQRVIVGLALAVLFMIGRDFGLAWRFHTIASPDLSWLRAFKVDLMCAFTSAITPSAVGGSALAIFYLNREGVDLGRATALTLTTLFLDEMFFVVFCPLIIIFMPLDVLFGGTSTSFLEGIQIAFWLVYAGIVAWTLILFLGIIVMPHKVAVGLDKLFSVKLLRRWHAGAVTMGENMVATSRQIKEKPRRWWLNVFGATTMSWFSRYLIVNALFWGFCPEASPLLIFSRQFVVWVILMISPTPGGSGISEWLFTTYYGDLIGSVSIALVLALAWRLISYYIYLAIGVMILPSYFSKRKKAI